MTINLKTAKLLSITLKRRAARDQTIDELRLPRCPLALLRHANRLGNCPLRRILGEYIEPGPRDATRTVERPLAVLDKNDVVHVGQVTQSHKRKNPPA
jgi:hypothetical protein